MNQRPQKPAKPARSLALLGAAAVLLMALCCAGPVVIAGGALAGVGGLLGNPWVIGAGVALLVTAVTAFARRGKHGDSCCPAAIDPPAARKLGDLVKGGNDNV